MKLDYFEYLEYLPKIPNDLEKYIIESLNGKDLFHIPNDVYKIYDAHEKLKIFLKDYFDESYNIRVQRITSNVMIHVDHNRTEAINYIILSGGDNVQTSFYSNDLILLSQIKIKNKKWHKLKVDVKHSVNNIISDRIAITIHIPLKK